MARLEIELPPKLIQVFEGDARYRCAYGGRGSGKTRSFAKMAAVKALIAAFAGRNGIALCAREYMNSLDESSLAEVKAAIASEPWLKQNYEIGEKFIRTRSGLPGRVDFKFVGLSKNLDSIKSKAQILLCWIDEADPVSAAAFEKLRPTVRESGSEIWITWNPERKGSEVDKRFRLTGREDQKICEINWRDNPWFPDVLEGERLDDLEHNPDQYDHIWEGGYKTVYKGAYYAKHLAKAKAEGRIGKVPFEPMMDLLTYHDLAGASDKADAYAMWPLQFVSKEIRIHSYYEAIGQPPEAHVQWLRGYCIDKGAKRCHVILPHDGAHVQINWSWENLWRNASDDQVKFIVRVVKNQGKGAAMQRVLAMQHLFPRTHWNEEETEPGRDALAAYHEKRDDERNIGLGPNHNWASHGSDAIGLMAIDYSERKGERPLPKDKWRRESRAKGSAWSAV
ncbi:MAG: phage terminase large subunit [Pseudomonadota bacterium]